jgi:CheY-like chemotaxis protein
VSEKRIVIVDDDPDFLEFARIVLSSAGYQVDTAMSADEGLTLIRFAVPDLIITDVMMSYTLEGIELAHEITHDPVLANVPLLVVTSIARTVDSVGFDEETEQAVKGFLTKPISPDELLTRIGCFLSEGR